MRHYRTAEMRHRDEIAWQALVSGALDLATNPIPDDPAPRLNSEGYPLHQFCRHGAETYCRWCDAPDPWEDGWS